jgi:ATP-dependent RNA helicase DeaD
MNLPSVDAVNAQRIAKFKQRVTETIAKGENDPYRPVIEQLEAETGIPLIDIAAALASLAQGASPLLLAGKPEKPLDAHPNARARARRLHPRAERPEIGQTRGRRNGNFSHRSGSVHGIKPGNIVGAIANEAGIEGVHIGRVDIREDHSFVDLPEGMPTPIFKGLQKVRVAGRELRISRVSEKPPKPPRNPAGRHTERKLLTRR